MYCSNYKFSRKPFDVTPDPEFLYLSPDHTEVLAALIYGISERRGFIVIIGEVGTGKTTVINAALDKLDKKTKVAYVFNTDVPFEQMLQYALVDLGLATHEETLSKTEAINRLNEFAIQQLTENGNVVFIVDEAQNLDLQTMENLRLLSNLETRKHKLIQIVLSGQPELDAKLGRYELRQFTQRISVRRYITPLNENMVYEYVRHRLAIAGCQDSSLFSNKALQLIWQFSRGVPRKINILCDNALLIGYGSRKKKIGAKEIEEAIRDLSCSPFSGVEEPRPEDQRPAEPQPVENHVPPPVRENSVDEKANIFPSRFLLPIMTTLTVVVVSVFIVGYLLGNFQLDSSSPNNSISRGSIPAGHLDETMEQTPGKLVKSVAIEKTKKMPETAAVDSEKYSSGNAAEVKLSSLSSKGDLPTVDPLPKAPQIEQAKQNVSAQDILNNKGIPENKAGGTQAIPSRDIAATDIGRSPNKSDQSPAARLPDSEIQGSVTAEIDSSRDTPENLSAGGKSENSQRRPVKKEMTANKLSDVEKIMQIVPAEGKSASGQDAFTADVASSRKRTGRHPAESLTTLDGPGGPDSERMPEKRKDTLVTSKSMKKKVAENPQVVFDRKAEKAKTEAVKVVMTEEGDILSGIIARTYGKYNDTLLFNVLKENPNINNPNLIYVDQAIKMPILRADH